METMWSTGRTRGVNGLGEELWNISCSMGRVLERQGCKTWIRSASAGDSRNAWAGCNQDCFEADSGSKSGKTLDRSKINGKGRKVELIILVPSLRIYQLAALHSNRISMWELMSPEQCSEAGSSRGVRPCKRKGKLESVRVTDPVYRDGKWMMPGEEQGICDSGHTPWSWGRYAPKYLDFSL